MNALNYTIQMNGHTQAHIIYQYGRPTDPIYDSGLNEINELKLPQLIIEQKDFMYTHPTPSQILPPLSHLIYITQLSMRYMNITDDHIPTFPPNLTFLNLYYTSIRVLDNLPHTLKFIVLSTNPKLTTVILPPSLISFDAAYQGRLTTITFPPTITYLRFYQCAFKRLDRLTYDNIFACSHVRPCFVECLHPYTQMRNNQRERPYNPQPRLIFDCIKTVNRKLDEDITSVFCLLRDNSFYSTKIECPIINAIRLASNPPRRFSEFIVE